MVMSGQVLESWTDCLRSLAAVIRMSAAFLRSVSESMAPLSGLQESAKSSQRRLGNVMLDPLRVGLRGFRRHTERKQHIDHQPVACAHPRGKLLPIRGQE